MTFKTTQFVTVISYLAFTLMILLSHFWIEKIKAVSCQV